MLRFTAKQSTLLRRPYSTANPPPQSSGRGTNWPFIISGAAVIGGLGYYFSQTTEGKTAQANAKELGTESKQGTERYKQETKDKYYDAKAAAQRTMAAAEAQAQLSYDSLKSSANKAATDTQHRYDQLRSTLTSDVANAQQEAEKITEETKRGWFSWLGLGKTKAREARGTAAGKVAPGTEEVKENAEKHT